MRTRVPPYISYGTFTEAVNKCGLPEGTSHSLAVCVDENYGESMASQIKSAFRFFDFYNVVSGRQNFVVSELLNSEHRRPTLERMIRQEYADIWNDGISLATADWQELDDAISRHFRVRGTTVRAASRFLVNAAIDAGLSVSEDLRSPKPVPRTINLARETDRPLTPVQTPTEPTRQDYRLIYALIDQLPAANRWTESERDRWLRALAGIIDLLIDVAEPGGPEK